MPTTQRCSATLGLRHWGLMRPIAHLPAATMPMGAKAAKIARASVKAVSVDSAATVRTVVIVRIEMIAVIAVIAPIARTVRRWTTSSHWKGLPLIPEDQMHRQPL